MMFRSAVFALFASLSVVEAQKLDTSGNIRVSSDMGQELLMKATVVHPARFLADNQNNYDWMKNYSIRYSGCSSLVQVAGAQNNNNKNNNNGGMFYTQHLVRFSLCPVNSCSANCANGGEYVVNMADFVDTYTEAKMTALEYQCELIRESCYCENANDDQACENQCYTDAGFSNCTQYEGEEDFEVQRYMECQEMDGGNNKNNNNNNGNNWNGNYYYGSYYVGPYCPDGKNIYLGVFYDQGCSASAPVEDYYKRTGVELPYSTKSLVTYGDCIACKVVNQDNNNNNNNNNNNGNNAYEQYEIAELCSRMQEEAGRCETNLADAPYPDTSACDYIQNILPKLYAASNKLSSGSSSTSSAKNGKAAKAFAFVFAFTTVLFAAYAYFLYRKIKRGVVALSAQGV